MIDPQKLQGFSGESARTDFLSGFFFLWMKALKNLSLNGLEQKHHLEKPDSVFWLHQVAARCQDVWMRGLVQVPCQCPKWLSAPSASLPGTQTTGTVWWSPELHYCQRGKVQTPDTETISIQMNAFILTVRTGELVF